MALIHSLLTFLKTYWAHILFGMMLMAAGAWLCNLVLSANFATTEKQYQDQLAAQDAAFSQYKDKTNADRLVEAKKAQENLQAAIRLQQQYKQQADDLSSKLLATQKELAVTKNKLRGKISDATKQDGGRFTGIGPSSLCLYESALGYFPDCDQRLSKTVGGNAGHPGDAAGTATGLSPAGILTHASDYGEWCLTLKSHLESIQALYAGGREDVR